jgi:DNA (cytosine-5)-methyltransferase 1
MKQNKLTVIDFFCGAGGFSEGFKQQGFDIILGIDHWKPAIETYNYNFNKNFNVRDILEFSKSIDEIENLVNTDVIIGSPPCVSFSSSNKSGKADKSLGLELTETFLKIVAVKKHMPNSKLKAWYMENVVNSKKFLKPFYTFNDLGLSTWAKKNGKSPNSVAIEINQNSTIINSADYGSIQSRKRAIVGEIIKYKKLIIPPKCHKSKKEINGLPNHKNLKYLFENFPSPFQKKSELLVNDPLYNFAIPINQITDHFYDTGIYKNEWENSKYLKVNHPYMGLMSFPENIENPSRTITATKIANSRESIIFKTEITRKGDGEYRMPTVREAAIIMGFPITYQFIGSENSKWRLVGNAVCPSVSRALAKEVIKSLFGSKKTPIKITKIQNLEGVINLNTFKLKTFDNPPIKKINSRFRRHPFKSGNMTVALSNFDIISNSKNTAKWHVTAFYGTGEGFESTKYKEDYYKKIEPIILKNFDDGKKFINIINNGFSKKIGSSTELQEMYELQKSTKGLLEPTLLVEEIAKIINELDSSNAMFKQGETKIFKKQTVPKKQLYALYALNKITSIANLK